MANPWERDWSQSGEGVYIPPSASSQKKKSAEAEDATNQAAISGVQAGAAPAVVAADLSSKNTSTTGQQIKNTADEINLQRGALSDEARRLALDGYSSGLKLLEVADELEKQYFSGPLSKTSGWSGIKDFIPGVSGPFNNTANQARGDIKKSLGFTGGEGNTMAESDATYGPYTPSNWDTNESVLNKIKALRSQGVLSARKAIQVLGGTPDESGKVVPLPVDENGQYVMPDALAGRDRLSQFLRNTDVSSGGGPAQMQNATIQAKGRAGANQNPKLAGLTEELRRLLQNGATADDLIIHEGRRMSEAGIPLSEDRQNFLREVAKVRDLNPSVPVGGLPIDWSNVETSEESEGAVDPLGRFGELPYVGPFGVNAVNAAAVGIPGAIVPNGLETLDTMRAESPGSSLAGDITGATATILGGMGYGPAIAKRFAGLLPDVGYSTIRGGLEGGPAGAGVGFGLGLAGNRAGAAIGGGSNNVRARFTDGGSMPEPHMRVLARNIGENEPDQITRLLTAGRELGAPVNVLDVAPSLLPLAGAAFRRAEPPTRVAGAQRLTDRTLDQGARLDNAISRNLGPIENPLAAEQRLIEQARRESAPLYEAFRGNPPATSPTIESIIATAPGQRSLNRARELHEMETLSPLSYEPGMPLSPSTLDYIKRGFDDEIDRSMGIDSSLGRGGVRALKGMRGQYVSELDSLFPNYAAAREAYAGPASIAESILNGTGFTKASRHSLPDEIPLEPALLEGYRTGARASLSDIANEIGDSRNPWANAFGSSAKRENLNTAFDPEGARKMLDALGLEKDMIRTSGSLIGNSATAQRIVDDSMFADETSRILGGALVDAVTNPTQSGVIAAGLGLARNAAKDRIEMGSFRNLEGIGTKITDEVLNPALDAADFERRLADAIAYNVAKENAQKYGSSITTGGFNSLGSTQ